MLKFLIDENISKSTVNFLLSLGYDVKNVHDFKLSGANDSDILRKAALTSRIVITHDLDFGNLVVFPVYYTGVIILRLKDQTPLNTNRILKRIFKKIEPKTLTKSLIVAAEDNLRIRPLE